MAGAGVRAVRRTVMATRFGFLSGSGGLVLGGVVLVAAVVSAALFGLRDDGAPAVGPVGDIPGGLTAPVVPETKVTATVPAVPANGSEIPVQTPQPEKSAQKTNGDGVAPLTTPLDASGDAGGTGQVVVTAKTAKKVTDGAETASPEGTSAKTPGKATNGNGSGPVVASSGTAQAGPAPVSEPVLEKKSEKAPKDSGKGPVVVSQARSMETVQLPGTEDLALGHGGDDPAVFAPVAEKIVIASLEPRQPPGVDTAALAKPRVQETRSALRSDAKLRFDLVRVDPLGSAIIAGKAPAGNIVEIKVDGDAAATVKADSKGSFVALFDMPPSEEPQVVTLSAANEASGSSLHSSDRVIVFGRKASRPAAAAEVLELAGKAPAEGTTVADEGAIATATSVENEPIAQPAEESAPAVILASEEGVKVVQPAAPIGAAPEVMTHVSLDLIYYDETGEIVLSGRSRPDRHVRIYVDDQAVKTRSVADDGSWRLALPEVKAGRYTLRVDELGPQGQVTSRLETPFQKEGAETARRVASNQALGRAEGGSGLPQVQKVTVQRGHTLWALARQNYGKGDLYMLIFNANREYIRNPDLIYPGQIFTIPE